ncbi:MAG: endonuclease III [Rhodothermales bacterium]
MTATTNARSRRAARTMEVMHELYPGADCALDYAGAHELLFATILSAQTTDATVNKVTAELFRTYRTVDDFANADPETFQELIRSTGFYRNKTKHVIGAARKIVAEHDGEVPDTMEELVQLPGVARKTANVVLGTYFKKPSGFVVDTHVKRVAYRIGLTDEKRPEKVEEDLMEVFPRDEWIFLGHALIHHGRKICDARNPQCGRCPLSDACLQRGVKK